MNQRPAIRPEFYQERAELHRKVHERLGRQSRLLSNLRGLSFAAWILAWGFALFGKLGQAGFAAGAVALVLFVGLVMYHAKVIHAENLAARWVSTNEDAKARVAAQAWHDLPDTGERFRIAQHPYAEDLDLLGRASLYQRLCVAKTQLGQARLAASLLEPASSEEIRKRQVLIAELAPLVDLRQHLEVLARATTRTQPSGTASGQANDLESLFAWAEAPPTMLNDPAYRVLGRAMPVVTSLILGLAYFGFVPASMGLLPLIAHVALLLRARRAMAPLIRMLATSEQTVLTVEPLFALLETMPESGALRATLDNGLKGHSTAPSIACRTLRRVAGWFEFRHNGLVYPFVNLYLLWDIQCALAFDAWRKLHGPRLRGWFALLGEVEALSSLAGFMHDEPNTCFAEIVDGEAQFEADALGHPLIDLAHRVCNDVSRLRAGQGLLVTGSNMSGKSTFLRALGLGAVVGLAGGPVCAKRLRVSPLAVATSMRISDSLAGGVSHFYAELAKLKAVVESSQAKRGVFFLLDEILHGTNSRERQIGARFILAQLLRHNALGAVSTHDLALCELSGDLADRLELVHFRESVQNETMSFDFLLRAGPVTAGNALRLMRSLGLDVPLE